MKLKTSEMTIISMFAALTAIGAFVKIPTPLVPFTLQFLFCAYAGVLLGARKGLYSQLLYVGIGLLGIPVFTNGGGITYIFQPTFGYLIGFILCAYIIGKLTQNLEKVTFVKVFLPVLAGLAVLYFVGVSYLFLIVNFYLGKQMSVSGAIAAGLTPFITADLIWSYVVAQTAIFIVPVLRKSGLITTRASF